MALLVKLSTSQEANYAKANSAIKITKEGLEPFVENVIKEFQQKCLTDICNNQGLPAGTICMTCCTENLVVCPTRGICIVGRGKCSYHLNSAKRYRPSGCPNKICHNFISEIQKAHRFHFPSYKNTDATQWCTKPWEVAKCFMPEDGYAYAVSATETDFNGIISTIINHNDFDAKLNENLGQEMNVFEQASNIGKTVRHSATFGVEDRDLPGYFQVFQQLLSDGALLAFDNYAQNAKDKLLQLNSKVSYNAMDVDDGNTNNPPSRQNPTEFTSRYASDFDHIKVLGSGGFGVVFEAKNKVDECHYAIKRISLPNSKGAEDKYKREVKALAKLNHVGIVRFYNAWMENPPHGWQEVRDQELDCSEGVTFPSAITQSTSSFHTDSPSKSEVDPANNREDVNDSDSVDIEFRSSADENSTTNNNSKHETKDADNNEKHHKANLSYLYIQMQLCKRETLKDWLESNTLNRDKHMVLDMFHQIVCAVKYVHDCDLMHRDIKPSNIFFSDDGVIKIGDFGLVKALSEGQNEMLYGETYRKHTAQVGTHIYMSPEQTSGEGISQKVDIYSLGVILFELLYPFDTQMERVRTLQELGQQNFPDKFTTEMQYEASFVKSLLSPKPEDRPSADEILSSDLLKDFKN